MITQEDAEKLATEKMIRESAMLGQSVLATGFAMCRGNTGSPNYCWGKAGYKIVRELRKNEGSKIRHIYNPKGELILSDAGFDAEMLKIKKLGINI